MSTTSVLALSPGASVVGIAIVEGFMLWRFEVHGRENLEPVAAIIASDRPGRIVLEELEGSRNTSATRVAHRAVRAMAREHAIPVSTLPLRDAQRCVVGVVRPTRLMLHQKLAARFPVLASATRSDAGRSYSSRDTYWERAFAALALAICINE